MTSPHDHAPAHAANPPASPAANPLMMGSPEADPRPLPRPVIVWLVSVIALIGIIIVLGALTRLTQSGLSMVDWNPLFESFPLTEEAWVAAFEAYRQYPEYQLLNYGMSLGEFQFIFLMEYAHRMWGRLIGVAYALPFFWFLATGALRGRRAWQLAGLLLLGGLQGLMGWYMVQSGLVDEPRVSPYRLTAHLGLAILIAALLLWIVLRELALHDRHQSAAAACRRLRLHAVIGLVLTALTIASGGFVAGLDAGLSYNSFPLMDGALIPPGLFDMAPWWRNLFENVPMVQFNHRWLAIVTMITLLALWWRAQPLALSRPARRALAAMAAMALIQPALGIATLLLMVPTGLATLHQAGAVILLGCILWSLSALTPLPRSHERAETPRPTPDMPDTPAALSTQSPVQGGSQVPRSP